MIIGGGLGGSVLGIALAQSGARKAEAQLANTREIEAHYASGGITTRVLSALRAVNGPDAPITPDTLAPLDHFHARGAMATSELAALLQPMASDHLLDIGCGIGGPARWFAAKFGCHVTGVDLTAEFCTAARELNDATGLGDRLSILHGSALALPVPDASFDRAYSQHVLMNIADKKGFFGEAHRALRPGGLLALSNVAAGSAGEPRYPLPWATKPATSFLTSQADMRADLLSAGFEMVIFRDASAAAVEAQTEILQRLETEGLPPLGEHIVMGESTKEWRLNAMRSLAEGRLSLIEALVRKIA
jgi:SAM-dependent methyltransferase